MSMVVLILRSHDGSMLVVSSSDGYCSIIHFKGGELGKPYHLTVAQVLEGSSSKVGQNIDDPGKALVNLPSGIGNGIGICTSVG